MATEETSTAAWRARYGPWALVTGASDGIGCAIARDLAGREINLVLVARRSDRLQLLATELETKQRVECRVIVADLGRRESVASLLAEVEALDVGLLAACAGFATSGRFLSTPVAEELDMLDLNCRTVLEMTHVMGGRFTRRGRGGIILMSSIVAFQGVRNAANYAATKAYIQSLAEGIAGDLAVNGVDVLASIPGPVTSGFGERAHMQMGRGADPALVARETLDALGKKRSVRPGLLSKVLTGSLSTLPRFGRRAVMAQIMRGFTKHHGAES